MQLGMVGLGRMGSNLVRRLLPAGHECVVYDVNNDTVKELAGAGATGGALEELVAGLQKPRALWVMVPAGEITEQTVSKLGELMDDGDTDHRRRELLLPRRHRPRRQAVKGRHPLRRRRHQRRCVGPKARLLADDRRRRRSRAAARASVCRDRPGRRGGTTDPGPHWRALEHPEDYRYDLNLTDVTEVWRRGSVIASWLLDLTASALFESPELEDFSGRVSDSGEGRWTAIAAVEEGVPAPVLLTALFSRFGSRELDHFANQALSAMRSEFGGHVEKFADKTAPPGDMWASRSGARSGWRR